MEIVWNIVSPPFVFLMNYPIFILLGGLGTMTVAILRSIPQNPRR